MKIIDVLTSPWAIQREKYEEIVRIYQSRARGEAANLKAVEAQLGFPLDNEQERYEVIDGVAVIPVLGVLAKRMNMLTRISGGSSTQLIMKDLVSALDDPVVKSVMLVVDSPGGTVDGTQDLANAIYEARGTKPIYALADGMAASAAYWIASAADRLYASNGTTLTGSIGVVTGHVDVSKAEEKAGVKTTEIYAGKYKRIVSQYKPLDAEGEKYLQDYVDYYYSIFVEDVARNRGTDVETVLRDMADGRDFIGLQGVDAGLVDGIMSYGELLGEMKANGGLQTPSPRIQAKTKNSAIASVGTDTNQPGGGEMNSEMKDAVQAQATEPLATVTAESIQRDYPETANALYERGVAAGAEAERARIMAVEAQALPGHETLIAGLKFDGKTTGPEAAAKVVAAEKATRETRMSALEAEAPAPAKPMASTDDGGASLTQAEKDDREWNASAELREEFGEDREAYSAYLKASREGKVREGKKRE